MKLIDVFLFGIAFLRGQIPFLPVLVLHHSLRALSHVSDLQADVESVRPDIFIATRSWNGSYRGEHIIQAISDCYI